MSRTYCPPFSAVVSFLFIILVSVGMIAYFLRELPNHTESGLYYMSYFIILAFAAVAVVCSLIVIHMLFVKRALIPPPCQ